MTDFPKDTTSITLEVVDFPYVGVGSYFAVAFERVGARDWLTADGKPADRGPFPETQALIAIVWDTHANRQRYAAGSRWHLEPGDAP